MLLVIGIRFTLVMASHRLRRKYPESTLQDTRREIEIFAFYFPWKYLGRSASRQGNSCLIYGFLEFSVYLKNFQLTANFNTACT